MRSHHAGALLFFPVSNVSVYGSNLYDGLNDILPSSKPYTGVTLNFNENAPEIWHPFSFHSELIKAK